MNIKKVGALVASIGQIAGAFGVPGAQVLSLTIWQLIKAEGYDTAGKSGDEIIAELEAVVAEHKKAAHAEIDKLGQYFGKT